jgi:hypothetical protein
VIGWSDERKTTLDSFWDWHFYPHGIQYIINIGDYTWVLWIRLKLLLLLKKQKS